MASENFSLVDGILVLIAVLTAAILFRPAIRDAVFWRATVTPLASIIGSGFLVVAPMLASIAGVWSVLCIIVIVLLSIWIGSALRFNILYDGRSHVGNAYTTEQILERVSDLALALAYVISVTFYIRLMSGFVLDGFDVYTGFNADVLASAVLVFIGAYGWRRGLLGLERLEEFSVTIKLAVIVALLVGLMYFDISQGYDLGGFSETQTGLWDGARKLAGLLLIVQGFETSKYLASAYGKELRSRSMRLAQYLAGIIYVAFVAMALPLMAPFTAQVPSETAIIGLSGQITLILPLMLVLAATMSQFSAAIADTIGTGGVVESVGQHRLLARHCYPLITLLAIGLMWSSHIFEIVALASRAFAFYYLLQTLQAVLLAFRHTAGKRRWLIIGSYSCLAVILLWVVLFAIPVEG